MEGRLNAPNMVKEQEGDEEGAGGSPEEAELELDRWDSVTKLTLWCHILKVVLLWHLFGENPDLHLYDNDGIYLAYKISTFLREGLHSKPTFS